MAKKAHAESEQINSTIENATVNFKEGKLSINDENVFQWLDPQDLLAFKNFADILYAFYDNEKKVYGGEFGINDSDRYKQASKESAKYLKVKELIFNEIKKRTDTLYEKSLVQN